MLISIDIYIYTSTYSPENEHRTWKWPLKNSDFLGRKAGDDHESKQKTHEKIYINRRFARYVFSRTNKIQYFTSFRPKKKCIYNSKRRPFFRMIRWTSRKSFWKISQFPWRVRFSIEPSLVYPVYAWRSPRKTLSHPDHLSGWHNPSYPFYFRPFIGPGPMSPLFMTLSDPDGLFTDFTSKGEGQRWSTSCHNLGVQKVG